MTRNQLSLVLLLAMCGCKGSSNTEAAPKPVEATNTTKPADKPTDKDEAAKTEKAFGDIYKQATWGSNDSGVGNSGVGSTEQSTAVYRLVLQQFLANNGIKSVVDAGCGDWEFSHLINWSGIDYKGFDIVAAVVEQDKKRYEAPNVHFSVGNIVEDDLPAADLLISKHVLQHLPNADIQKFLTKQLVKYKHVLLTNGVDPTTLSATNGTDIEPGQYRQLDVTKPPFNIPGVKILTYWDDHHMSQVIHIERK